MSDAAICTERDGAVLHVINNNEAALNALTVEFYDAFQALMRDVRDDRSVRVVVLSGAGRFFCAGGDVNRLKQRLSEDLSGRRSGAAKLNGVIRAIRACPRPVIAAIEGGAAGAGVSLALACDLIVAARDAYFAVSHVRIGVTPDGGATAFLARSLPRQLVTELCMTGARIEAERLHGAGLVNELCARGRAREQALALAARLAEGPAGALAVIKKLVEEGARNSLEQHLEREADAMAEALGGAEAREGVAAFLEKRKADFAGAD